MKIFKLLFAKFFNACIAKSSFCCVLVIMAVSISSVAQYPPAAGQPGTTALPADSNCFVGWANGCTVFRGFVNMTDTTVTAGGSNRATYGNENAATGQADNTVVSLGDKGTAVLTFEFPIVNGPGWDFAVFENGLNDTFLELAFVEVSSNGTDFFRFPSVSLTQTDLQTGSFGSTEAFEIHNLAGKYRAMYGVPFNIDDLVDHPLLDKNNITQVRLIDVGGSVNPVYASYDFTGNIINDPFPSPFESCGFDLDAVGVINNTQTGVISYNAARLKVFPDPAEDYLCVDLNQQHSISISVYNISGGRVISHNDTSRCIDVSGLLPGVYVLQCIGDNSEVMTAKFVKL